MSVASTIQENERKGNFINDSYHRCQVRKRRYCVKVVKKVAAQNRKKLAQIWDYTTHTKGLFL